MPTADAPRQPQTRLVRLQLQRLTEEFMEVLEAVMPEEDAASETYQQFREVMLETPMLMPLAKNMNLAALARELADLDLTAEGTRQLFGIDGAPVEEVVCRANLTREGYDHASGKVAKGQKYTPPDVETVIQEQIRRGSQAVH